MGHEPRRALHLNPLADVDVQRALALSRARESYPAVPRETLLGYCDAAWQVAVRADPTGRDLHAGFDRALLMIAWTQRRSGGRVPLRQLVDETIPRVALAPFVAARPEPVEAESREEEPEPAREVRPRKAPAWRSLPRVPFSSPIPVGAAVAAGVVGVAILGEARVLPIEPLQPTAGEDVADREAAGDDRAPAGRRGSAPADPPAATGRGPIAGSWESADLRGEPAQLSVPPNPPEDHEALRAADSTRSDRTAATEELASASGSPAELVASAPEVAQAPAAVPPEPVAPAPSQPVVRIELPPPEMVVEVSVPSPVETGGDGQPDRPERPSTRLPGGADDGADETDAPGEEGGSEPGDDGRRLPDDLTDSLPGAGGDEDEDARRGDDPQDGSGEDGLDEDGPVDALPAEPEPPAADAPEAPGLDDGAGNAPADEPTPTPPAEPPAPPPVATPPTGEPPAATPPPPAPPPAEPPPTVPPA